jgi:puromycin-sensitive aminopeptidase
MRPPGEDRVAARRKPKKSRKKRGAKPRLRAHRLAADVRPVEVDLEVEVDPESSPTFRGEVVHRLVLEKRRRALELNADDLTVSGAVVEAGGRRLRGRITRRPERETIQIALPEAIPAGAASLRLAFRGKLRSDLRGLYAASAGGHRYAFTQLEAADARRFFPCFDEPAMKARFRLSVTTATANTVLSNSPVEKVEPLPNGRKTLHFRRTPPLSTYLLALGVGELVASEPVHCGATEIRVWHVPGKEGLTAFGLEAARETLARLETYFDLPYPYEKLDLVAVPDFEAGAMENAGAVFFRETLLLVDPESATLQEKKRAAEVICHELAHMWYGDLVTMAWWDDLWLNEAFATWMAFHVVDAWKPEWKMWNDFQHHRSAALGLDALSETHPIYVGVRTPAEATENFDLITYEKGASVVRMIERFLGAETFRDGVRRYIRAHRESNAVASDLWSALAEASGQNVEPVVRAWIEQPGFPLLRLKRKERDGRSWLRFEQARFLSNPSPRANGTLWPVPFVGRLAAGESTRTVRQLLTRRRGEIELPVRGPRFVYGNAEEGGFYRPLHDESELAALAGGLDALAPIERMGLIGHQWAAARAGFAGVGSFLDLALAFSKERDPDVLVALRSPLELCARSVGRSLGADAEAALRAEIARIFADAFDACGWDTEAEEGDDVRLRRAALLALVGELGELPAVLREARTRCETFLDDRRSLEPNLADPVVSLAARAGDEALFERFLAASGSATTPQDQRRFLLATGAFSDPKLVDRALALTLTDSVGTQDVALLLSRLIANRGASERAWAFWKRRFTKLRRRMPPMLVTRPIEALPALGTKVWRRDVASFFRENPVPTGARSVKQTLEQFDLNLAFDARTKDELSRWLESR